MNKLARSVVVVFVVAFLGALGWAGTQVAGTLFNGVLAAGSNVIGKVTIDQTTPGTTNLVAASLNAETTKVIGTVNLAASQTLATVTTVATVSAVTAITNALPSGTNTIGTVNLPASSAPTITKVGATTSSAQLLASLSTRKGVEIDTDCANTDDVAINFGAGAAVYATHKILKPCTSWQPPPGVMLTSAIQVISNTGTQQVRAVEYP